MPYFSINDVPEYSIFRCSYSCGNFRFTRTFVLTAMHTMLRFSALSFLFVRPDIFSVLPFHSFYLLRQSGPLKTDLQSSLCTQLPSSRSPLPQHFFLFSTFRLSLFFLHPSSLRRDVLTPLLSPFHPFKFRFVRADFSKGVSLPSSPPSCPARMSFPLLIPPPMTPSPLPASLNCWLPVSAERERGQGERAVRDSSEQRLQPVGSPRVKPPACDPETACPLQDRKSVV